MDNGEDACIETRAIGQRGFLIRGMEGEIYFRVYNDRVYDEGKNEDHSFTDYEISNFDCEVVIIDPHAAFIRGPAGDFLDYTAESMGYSK